MKAPERKPRGEIAELSASLQSLCTSGKRSDKELRAAKKEVFKKVINFMTVGMDMSPLFPMMTSCANLSPDDLVLKKLLYLYITHYASQTPDLALLAINQLQKDCRDQDPTIRGSALRSLCSLRVANFLEYVTSPILMGLEDRHPYVRRTAAMGVLKVYHIDAAIVSHQGMLDRVRRLLSRETDPQVIANCLIVIMQMEGAANLLDKALIYSLINRIKDFSDWAQCAVLELVSRYRTVGEGEVFDILNALEDRMSHVNSAVVMATIKVFLHLTLSMPATHQQVLERLKDPLKTLISREESATVYAALAHVLVLVQRAPMIFEKDYVAFYCRTHDPSYIKKLKLEILAGVANTTNVYEIVGELTEYARDINPSMAREAIRAIGRIALSVPDVNGIVERLLLFLDTGSEHILAEALIQMKDLLRRYPDMSELCIASISGIAPMNIMEADAKAALIWMMGQFGHAIKAAPYVLEPVAEVYATEEVGVRLALLTAAAQLFFKRPPEVRPLLGKVLAAGVTDPNQDVRDRALLYHRLLRVDLQDAERLINPPLLGVTWFSENTTPEMRDTIFAEFNSLSVIYQAPAHTFVTRQAYHQLFDEPEAEGAADQATNLLSDAPENSSEGGDLLDIDRSSPAPRSSTPPAAPSLAPSGGGVYGGGRGGGAPTVVGGADALMDLADVLMSPPLGAPVQQQSSSSGTSSAFMLVPQAWCAPADFQERWRAYPPAHTYSEQLSPPTVAALPVNNHKDFCAHMAQAYIYTVASGGQEPTYKYYFFGEGPSRSMFLIEMVVRTDTCTATVTMKTDNIDILPQYAEIWMNCLAGFYR